MVLPKKAVRYLQLSKSGRLRDAIAADEADVEDLSLILIATNKGLILRPFNEYIQDDEMRSRPEELVTGPDSQHDRDHP
jgi:hypothetical protein